MTLFQYFKGETIAFCKTFTELWNFQNTLSWALKFVRSEVHAVESYFSYMGPDLESSLLQLKST